MKFKYSFRFIENLTAFLYEMIQKYVFARTLAVISRPYIRKYQGENNIPKGKGNVVFIANHTSLLDTVLLVPNLIRRIDKIVYVLGDRKVWKSNLFLALCSKIAAIGILMNREDPRDIKFALAESIKKLKSGKPLLVFPEGTRLLPGNIAAFQKGIYIIAFRAKPTIVPIYLKNVHVLSHKGKRFPSILKALFKISIIVGPEITYDKYHFYKNRSDDFCEYLRKKLLELSD